jgi:hypothetical protein
MARAPIQWAGWKCRIGKIGVTKAIICKSNKANVSIIPTVISRKKGVEKSGTVKVGGKVSCTMGKKRNVALCNYWEEQTMKRDRKKIYPYKPRIYRKWKKRK